jgi:AmiR/NasT family two-component response regulator
MPSTFRRSSYNSATEQAKGVLMERHGLDEQAAFDQLRRLPRSSGRRPTDVAHDVVGDRSR